MRNFDLSQTTILTDKDVTAFRDEFQKTLIPIPDDKIDQSALKKLVFGFISRNEQPKSFKGLIDPTKVNRVLLFRYDALGDYILTTPVPRLLKGLNPNMEIDILTSPRNNSIIRLNPFINKTYIVKPTKNFNFSLLDVINQTKHNNYDVIFGLVFHSMTVNSFLAAGISPTAEKITMQHKGRETLYGQVFNRQIKHSFWREHYTQTMARTVTDNFAGADSLPKELFENQVYLEKKHFDNIQDVITEHDLNFKSGNKKPYIASHPDFNPAREGKYPFIIFNLTSNSVEKKMDPEIAASAISALSKLKPHVKFFVTASPSEYDLVDRTVSLSNTEMCYPIKQPLNDFIAFLSGASFLISPDTGTVHIAAALNIPQLVLFVSPQSICEWHPYNSEFYGILTGDERGINVIKPELIVEAARKFDKFNAI